MIKKNPRFDNGIRKTGGGRKKETQKRPELKKEFNNVIQKYKAGSPIDENLIWIDVSVSELTNEIINNGQYCSNYLCKQMLKEENLKQRKMKKCITLKEVEMNSLKILIR